MQFGVMADKEAAVGGCVVTTWPRLLDRPAPELQMAVSELSSQMLETGEALLMIIPKELALAFLTLCRAYCTNSSNAC